MRILLYARNNRRATYTTLRWICELEASVTVIDDASNDGTDSMLRIVGSGYDIVTNGHERGFPSSIAYVALEAKEEFVLPITSGFVPMPGWLEALRAALQSETVAAASLVLSARKHPLTLDGNASDSRFTFLQPATRVPVAGSLLRRDLAAALGPQQISLTAESGGLLFQPAAVGLDLLPCRLHAPVAVSVPGRCVAFFDSHAPYYDREGGSHRLWHMMQIARGGGWHVVFVPTDGFVPEPYLSKLRQSGIEVLCPAGGDSVGSTVQRRARTFDVAWMSRPSVAALIGPIIRSENPYAGTVYDAVDLYHVRARRQAEFVSPALDWQSVRDTEFALARAADVVVAVADQEKILLEEAGLENVAVIPTIHRPVTYSGATFDEREGLLFIGSYDHEPNVDAVQYLCARIMPLVRQGLPTAHLTLLGNNPPPQVRALGKSGIAVPGYVADVDPFFGRARIFVAPLRYGAGMKAKLTQAFAHGIPSITTSVGAEGLSGAAGAFVVADDEHAFAAAILGLYQDRATWESNRERALTAARCYEPCRVSAEVFSALERCVEIASRLSRAERSTLPVTPR